MYYFLWLNITNILPIFPPTTIYIFLRSKSYELEEKIHKEEEEKEAKIENFSTLSLSLFFFLSSNSIIIIIMNLG